MKKYFLIALFLLVSSFQSILAQSTIMIMGDSLSNGYQLPPGKSWGSFLQQCINNMHADILVVNESQNQSDTRAGLKNLPESLMAHQPDIVIIALGSYDAQNNQTPEQVQANLRQMIQLSQENDAKVILAGAPLSNAKYAQSFSDLAADKHLIRVDNLYADLKPAKNPMLADGLHANVEAQKIIMNTVWKKLYPLLDL